MACQLKIYYKCRQAELNRGVSWIKFWRVGSSMAELDQVLAELDHIGIFYGAGPHEKYLMAANIAKNKAIFNRVGLYLYVLFRCLHLPTCRSVKMEAASI